MLGMRLARGVRKEEFEAKFSKSFEKYEKKLSSFYPEYVNIRDTSYAFTDNGMLVSNYILSEILDF